MRSSPPIVHGNYVGEDLSRHLVPCFLVFQAEHLIPQPHQFFVLFEPLVLPARANLYPPAIPSAAANMTTSIQISFMDSSE